jgi:hypothetical protein
MLTVIFQPPDYVLWRRRRGYSDQLSGLRAFLVPRGCAGTRAGCPFCDHPISAFIKMNIVCNNLGRWRKTPSHTILLARVAHDRARMFASHSRFDFMQEKSIMDAG